MWLDAGPDTLILIYKSLIRIDYVIFTYFPRNKSMVDKLEAIQYSTIRISLDLREIDSEKCTLR